MEILLVWFVFAAGVAIAAGNKGRSTVGFFLLSALLSPIVGLIVLLVVGDKSPGTADAYAKLQAARDGGLLTEEQYRAQAAALGTPAGDPRLTGWGQKK